jgi:hypothetical protein
MRSRFCGLVLAPRFVSAVSCIRSSTMGPGAVAAMAVTCRSWHLPRQGRCRLNGLGPCKALPSVSGEVDVYMAICTIQQRCSNAQWQPRRRARHEVETYKGLLAVCQSLSNVSDQPTGKLSHIGLEQCTQMSQNQTHVVLHIQNCTGAAALRACSIRHTKK